MMALDLNAVSQASFVQIANCLIEGTLIAIAVASLLRVGRGLSSATRFAVWFSALVAIAALAMFGFSQSSRGALHSGEGLAPLFVVPTSWTFYILAGWALIAGVMLARLAMGLVHLVRLRSSCVALDSLVADSGLREALNRCGSSRKVELCISGKVNVPAAIGFFRPTVVMPAWLVDELSSEEIRQLVVHEIAHLRRWDDWTNLAQKVIKALFFFHPAVWWIEKQASLEREMACDDAVIAETSNPRAYAECLAHLAEKSVIRRGLALAQAAVGRIRQTSLRVARMLRDNRPVASRGSWIAIVIVMAGFAVLGRVVAPLTPRLIGFAQPQPEVRVPQPPVTASQSIAAQHAGVVTVHPAARLVPRKPRAEMKLAKSSSPKETRQAVYSPKPVPARLDRAFAEAAPLTQAVYVVVETGEYLPSGVVVWRSTVWRITVAPPPGPNPRISRKQI